MPGPGIEPLTGGMASGRANHYTTAPHDGGIEPLTGGMPSGRANHYTTAPHDGDGARCGFMRKKI